MWDRWSLSLELILVFCGMKRLSISTPPLDGMLVHHRVTPSIKLASTHLYTWVERERGTVRVKCHAPKHSTISPARAWTQTAWYLEMSAIAMRPHNSHSSPLTRLLQTSKLYYQNKFCQSLQITWNQPFRQ